MQEKIVRESERFCNMPTSFRDVDFDITRNLHLPLPFQFCGISPVKALGTSLGGGRLLSPLAAPLVVCFPRGVLVFADLLLASRFRSWGNRASARGRTLCVVPNIDPDVFVFVWLFDSAFNPVIFLWEVAAEQKCRRPPIFTAKQFVVQYDFRASNRARSRLRKLREASSPIEVGSFTYPYRVADCSNGMAL
jgi:hypothetical protein